MTPAPTISDQELEQIRQGGANRTLDRFSARNRFAGHCAHSYCLRPSSAHRIIGSSDPSRSSHSALASRLLLSPSVPKECTIKLPLWIISLSSLRHSASLQATLVAGYWTAAQSGGSSLSRSSSATLHYPSRALARQRALNDSHYYSVAAQACSLSVSSPLPLL